MGKTKIKPLEEIDQSSVLSDQLSDNSLPVTSLSVTDKLKTDEPGSENRQQKTDNRIKKHGKKYQEVTENIEKNKNYPLVEAVTLAQKASYSKFQGTLEAHINTSTKNLRGLINLPHLAGKKLTILAFGNGAKEAGADIVGTEEIIADIEKGPSTTLRVNSEKEVKLSDVDVIVVTPAWMPKLAKAAKVLGPRGLMPNPKSGTITDNLGKAISELRTGKTEYKTENQAPVIHLGVGETDQPAEEIAANIKTLFNTLGKSKIRKITLSATMGPGVKVDLSSI